MPEHGPRQFARRPAGILARTFAGVVTRVSTHGFTRIFTRHFARHFTPHFTRHFARLLPQSLLGRLSCALVAAVLLSQLVGNAIWVHQSRAEADLDSSAAALSVAHSAATTVRFFLGLPPSYHPLIIQQFREMGGTRFFATINRAPVPIEAIADPDLALRTASRVHAALARDLPRIQQIRIGFAWPDRLHISDHGVPLLDLPENWVQHIVPSRSKPAPILVMQVELQPGHWLYLATLMPNPYFLDSGRLLTGERLLLQAVTLAFVLLVALLVVRWSTYPLALLSRAADAFGKGEPVPALPQSGSREFVSTARAFSGMRERIQGYIEDRERLFVAISHDLRTPIMRLKFRTELLDDEEARAEFHEDLDELDMMVKSALQNVEDAQIHEDATTVRLDPLLERMVRDAHLARHQVSHAASNLTVCAKPLALKRAIGNLLDNGVYYGERVEISAREHDGRVHIVLRDHGPGVPEAALATLFDATVRLDHGRERNSNGHGLGLGIARWLVRGMAGDLLIANHPQGGLCATIILPAGLAGA
jgi:signal transduction histidine kinase